MRTGTAHFVSRTAAIRYYVPYHYENTVETVNRKILNQEIFIGPPERPLGHRIIKIDDGCRYAIEEIPNYSNVRECDNCDNFEKCVAIEMCLLGDLPAGEE